MLYQKILTAALWVLHSLDSVSSMDSVSPMAASDFSRRQVIPRATLAPRDIDSIKVRHVEVSGLTELGYGEFGTAYWGHVTKGPPGLQVAAVKIAVPVKGWEREVQAMSALHPKIPQGVPKLWEYNLMKVPGFSHRFAKPGPDGAWLVMVMDLARGGSVEKNANPTYAQYLSGKEKRADVLELWNILVESHKLGWYHMDIKNENILSRNARAANAPMRSFSVIDWGKAEYYADPDDATQGEDVSEIAKVTFQMLYGRELDFKYSDWIRYSEDQRKQILMASAAANREEMSDDFASFFAKYTAYDDFSAKDARKVLKGFKDPEYAYRKA